MQINYMNSRKIVINSKKFQENSKNTRKAVKMPEIPVNPKMVNFQNSKNSLTLAFGSL
jgi:hypothetical protein